MPPAVDRAHQGLAALLAGQRTDADLDRVGEMLAQEMRAGIEVEEGLDLYPPLMDVDGRVV